MAHKPTRSSTPFVIREIKIRIRMRDRYTPFEGLKGRTTAASGGESVEKLELPHNAGYNGKHYSHLETQSDSF